MGSEGGIGAGGRIDMRHTQPIIPPPPLFRLAYEFVQPVWPLTDMDLGGSSGTKCASFGLHADSSTQTPSKVLRRLLVEALSLPFTRKLSAFQLTRKDARDRSSGCPDLSRAHTRQFPHESQGRLP